jgi:hypothetical protein
MKKTSNLFVCITSMMQDEKLMKLSNNNERTLLNLERLGLFHLDEVDIKLRLC